MREMYVRRAVAAYEKYREVQARIDAVEKAANKRYPNKSLAQNRLANSEDYWEYRDDCALRKVHIEVATLNALMAQLFTV